VSLARPFAVTVEEPARQTLPEPGPDAPPRPPKKTANTLLRPAVLVPTAVLIWRLRLSFYGVPRLPARYFCPPTCSAMSLPGLRRPRPLRCRPGTRLRWDGIAQFYPWRHFASETIHTGTLPLWNPYQFSGTPFAANSQSAPF